MNAVGKSISGHMGLFNGVGSSLLNKGVDNSPMERVGVRITTFRGRIFVHGVNRILQFSATVDTELITFTILLRATIPTVLVTLVIRHAVDMLVCTFADNLRDLIALVDGGTNRQDREISGCGGLCILRGLGLVKLIGWCLCHSFVFHFFSSLSGTLRGNFPCRGLCCRRVTSCCFSHLSGLCSRLLRMDIWRCCFRRRLRWYRRRLVSLDSGRCFSRSRLRQWNRLSIGGLIDDYCRHVRDILCRFIPRRWLCRCGGGRLCLHDLLFVYCLVLVLCCFLLAGLLAF